MNVPVNIFSNSKILLIGLVAAVFIGQSLYIKYISSELEATKQEVEKEQKEKQELKATYELNLETEMKKRVFEVQALKSKEQVAKKQTKVKEEAAKRGEIKDDENSSFVIINF